MGIFILRAYVFANGSIYPTYLCFGRFQPRGGGRKGAEGRRGKAERPEQGQSGRSGANALTYMQFYSFVV